MPESDGRLAAHVVALVAHVHHVKLSIPVQEQIGYGHMGAILVDAILQAGMTYETVNARALQFRTEHPGAATTTGLLDLGGPDRLSEILRWSGDKPKRIHGLAEHLDAAGVDTVEQLKVFVDSPANVIGLREVNGVGRKTADYLCILVGVSTAAVDVHLRSFAAEAGLPALSYVELHRCYLGAAEQLKVEPRDLDQAVWLYASGRQQ